MPPVRSVSLGLSQEQTDCPHEVREAAASMFFGRSSRCSSCGVYVVVLAPALVRSLFDKDEKLEVAAQETKQSANIAEAPAETEEKKPRRTGYKMPRCAACGHTAQQHFAIGARQCRAKDGCTCQAFIEKIRSMTTTP